MKNKTLRKLNIWYKKQFPRSKPLTKEQASSYFVKAGELKMGIHEYITTKIKKKTWTPKQIA